MHQDISSITLCNFLALISGKHCSLSWLNVWGIFLLKGKWYYHSDAIFIANSKVFWIWTCKVQFIWTRGAFHELIPRAIVIVNYSLNDSRNHTRSQAWHHQTSNTVMQHNGRFLYYSFRFLTIGFECVLFSLMNGGEYLCRDPKGQLFKQ